MKKETLQKIKKKVKQLLLRFFIIYAFVVCASFAFYWLVLENEYRVSKNNIKINVIVRGVDNGLMNGFACEWGEKYAYYDSGKIYYYENKNSEPQIIECQQLKQLAMNDKFLFILYGSNIMVFDTHTTENLIIGNYKFYGINIYPDEVLLSSNYDEKDDYEMSETELSMMSKYEIKLSSDNNNCINRYSSDFVHYNIGSKEYIFNWNGYGLKNDDKKYSDLFGRWDAYFSVQRMSEYENKMYILLQRRKGRNIGEGHENLDYKNKDFDLLICIDLETGIAEDMYKTVGTSKGKEQIVNFSVENNQMFLLVDGILYKADLEGNSRVELASYVGSGTLAFDYANDTLFVYDNTNGKLLGQYR